MQHTNVDIPLLTVESVVMDAVHAAQEGRNAVSTVLPAGRYYSQTISTRPDSSAALGSPRTISVTLRVY